MDITQWLTQFLQINASAMVLNQTASLEISNIIFIAYLLLSIIIKRAVFITAFFVSCLLFNAERFDVLSESSLYLLTFAVYSYVIFDIACNRKAVIACGTIILLSIVLAYDSYHYGIGGIYGAHKTIVYQHIQHLALYAHIIFISTLIPYRRIGDSFRRCIDSIMLYARNSVNFVVL